MAPPPTAPQPGANGVLPVPAAALQKNPAPASANGTPRAASNRSQQPRLKLVVRRLAPGLTQQEFELALGDEWKSGQGKVDWFSYKPGKVSKDLAKPSKPSRAYLHLTEQAHVVPLADKVRKTAFTDAKNSTRDPALIGPPTVDFAPFNRIPGGRRRNDARQGLIDQDPEFKDFLESLTNPVPKSAPVDNAADEVAVKKDEVRTTPLIEHLREKKAAKEKPQPAKAQGKHGRGESKDEKAASKSEKKGRKGAKEEKSSKQSKAEKAAKESAPKEVKILNKASAGKNTESEKKDENKSTSGAPASERKRERGSASIAKQMLQRDLGIGPAAGGRRSRRDTAQEPAKTAAETTAAKDSAAVSPALSSPATPAPTAPAKTSSEARSGKKDSRPTRAERRAQKAAKASAEAASTDENKPTATPPAGPKILKKPQNGQQNNQKAAPAANSTAADIPANAHPPKAPTGPAAQQNQPAPTRPNSSRNANNASAAAAAAAPAPNSTAKQAFLKHANPSQGITEPLIEAALSVFGAIEKVEIDKRKGFAYVEFKEPDGLQKAIQASPVKVAEGAVQVLERKDKAPAQQRAPRVPPAGPTTGPMMGGRGGGGFRGGRGGRGRGGGGGGGANASTGAAAPAAASATPPAKAQVVAADSPS